MSDTDPAESMDAEGLSAVEDRPPGIDVETDSEGLMVPRDHPIAVGTDPAYPVTEAEERQVEGVAERAAREEADVGAEELGVGGGVQTGGSVPAQQIGGADTTVVGAFSNRAGPDVLAQAIDADGPLGTSFADDDVAATTGTAGSAGRMYEPDSGDGVDFDDEPTAVAYSAEDTDDGLSAEEAAVHLVDDPRS